MTAALIPTRIRVAVAALRGRPVAYRVTIAPDGLTVRGNGAVVAESRQKGVAFGRA